MPRLRAYLAAKTGMDFNALDYKKCYAGTIPASYLTGKKMLARRPDWLSKEPPGDFTAFTFAIYIVKLYTGLVFIFSIIVLTAKKLIYKMRMALE